MKAIWLKSIIVLLGLSVPAGAGVIQTIDFDAAKIQIDSYTGLIGYSDLEQIRDAGFPSVSYERYYFHAAGDAYSEKISGVVVLADTLEIGFTPSLNEADRVTSNIDYRATKPVILCRENGIYPAEPILAAARVVKGTTFWSVSVFPIQYLDDGRVIVNRLIEIHCGDDEAASRIFIGLPDDNDPAYQEPLFMKSPADSTDDDCPLGPEFVVVTSRELKQSFCNFVDLKIKTGFDAAIAITDDIYDRYDGIDDAEKLRNYLSDFYNSGGRYVLLGGDEDHVPVRYAYYYNTEISPAIDQLMICDMYFSDFDGDWDSDGDGIWGEPTADRPDHGAEVLLGRLPFSTPDQVQAYTEKLRQYLFAPGGDNSDYLARSVFITSDQMVDYFGDQGQQHYVAERIPDNIDTDCDNLAEVPSGLAPSPTGPFPSDAVSSLDNGYGFVNILAHGRPDGFILNSSEYNLFPKSYLLTGAEHIGDGAFDDLAASQKVGFYHTISCSQGAFDLESSYDMYVPSVVEKLLEIDSAGAVGVVAFSRWGWVGSSYRLMASFYEHLFSDAEGRPVDAMNMTYVDYPYYLDQIYGQNYHGDPSIEVYLDKPSEIQISAPSYYVPNEPVYCRITKDGAPLPGYPVVITIGEGWYQSAYSDGEGYAVFNLPEDCSVEIEVTVSGAGVVSASSVMYPSIAADADDDDYSLPEKFELHQNYPNPFNPATTIGFSLTRYQQVSLVIYDVLGRLVDRPIDDYLSAGEHEVVWSGYDSDGNDLPSGIYFYRLVSEEATAVRKMMLVK